MKKIYLEKPEMEVVHFNMEEICTKSSKCGNLSSNRQTGQMWINKDTDDSLSVDVYL